MAMWSLQDAEDASDVQAMCLCSSVEPVALSVKEFWGSAKHAKDVLLGLRHDGISTRAGTLKTNESLETSFTLPTPLIGYRLQSNKPQSDLTTASGVCSHCHDPQDDTHFLTADRPSGG
jgi:hypothetical protein